MTNLTCQSCGKAIEAGAKVVLVEIGTLAFTAHPHAKVIHPLRDWFHATCSVAIRWSEFWDDVKS